MTTTHPTLAGWTTEVPNGMAKTVQKTLHGPCGRQKVLALGLCPNRYNLKRQDEEYFGGLREQVLKRHEHLCRACSASNRDKGSIVVHHRVPGRSLLHLMISLCPACDAKVHRTEAALSRMSPLLLELLREQYSHGHEQTMLDFKARRAAARKVSLFAEDREGNGASAAS